MRRKARKTRRIADYVTAFAFLFLLALIAAKINRDEQSDLSGQTELAGPFSVIDGDTLVYDGQRLRLEGIDAPEFSQMCHANGQAWPCGTAAREMLVSMIEGSHVTCRGDRRDKYDRLLVRCSAGQADIGAEMVRTGYAVAYGDYEAEEAKARELSAGLWRGEFERPEDWRAESGNPAGETTKGSFLCSAIGVFCDEQQEETQ